MNFEEIYKAAIGGSKEGWKNIANKINVSAVYNACQSYTQDFLIEKITPCETEYPKKELFLVYTAPIAFSKRIMLIMYALEPSLKLASEHVCVEGCVPSYVNLYANDVDLFKKIVSNNIALIIAAEISIKFVWSTQTSEMENRNRMEELRLYIRKRHKELNK